MGSDSDLAARMARMQVLPTQPPTISSESYQPDLSPPQPTQWRRIVHEALRTLSYEELSAQMQIRARPYNDSATRAPSIIQIRRHCFVGDPPQIQRPLIIPQALPPEQPIVAVLMRRPVTPGGRNVV